MPRVRQLKKLTGRFPPAARPNGLLELSGIDIYPRDGGGPGGPELVVELRAIRKGDPPLSAFVYAAGEVHLAVVVEVAHLDVVPTDRGGPGAPKMIGEHRRAIRQSDPPLAELVGPADNIRQTVAV